MAVQCACVGLLVCCLAMFVRVCREAVPASEAGCVLCPEAYTRVLCLTVRLLLIIMSVCGCVRFGVCTGSKA